MGDGLGLHALGFSGMILALVAYVLVSSKRVRPDGVAYQAMNMVGAGVLLAYSAMLSAWASVGLNLVWGSIAVIALIRMRRSVVGK